MEINPQNFEHSALEADIERLSREIAEKKNLLEHRNLSAKELVKESLEPMFRQNIGQPNVGQPVQSVVVNQQTSQSRILPDYLQNVSSEIKLRVEELVDSLFHQGIEKVISRARRASPFILDAFHDALTDKLHEELKKRKLI